MNHQMHVNEPDQPDDDDEPRDRAALSVADRSLGKTRLLTRQCDTCVFRPGNLMHLGQGRLHDLVGEATRQQSFVVCHETLPYADPAPGVKPAICRGFHDRYSTTALQIIGRLWGFAEVDPPTGRDADDPHRDATLAPPTALAHPTRPQP